MICAKMGVRLCESWRRGGTDLGLRGRLELGDEAGVDAGVGRLHDPADLRTKLVNLLHRLRETARVSLPFL